jgi:hypothetical protein
MKLRYFVVQALDNGEWINYSYRYVLSGLAGALNCYKFARLKNPNLQLRIARGKEDVTW